MRDLKPALGSAPYELCRSCRCRYDRMIHAPGYSCNFVPSGIMDQHGAEVACDEEYCIPCGRPWGAA